MLISDEDLNHYWDKFYRYNLDKQAPFLFEVSSKNDDCRRKEYYISDESEDKFECFGFDRDDTLVTRYIVSRNDLLNIVRVSFPEYWKNNVYVDKKFQPDPYSDSMYGKHKMYVDLDFRSLVNVLIDTLSELGHYHESYKEDRIVKYEKADAEFALSRLVEMYSTNAYLFRSDFDRGNSGCIICVYDTSYYLTRTIDLHEKIHDWLVGKLETIPCVITFDFNWRFFGYKGTSVFDYFIYPLYSKLARIKARSILFTVDNEAYNIKTNPFLTEEERIEKICIYTGVLIDLDYNEKIVKKAKLLVGHYWEELSSVSKQILPIGKELYDFYVMYDGSILDSTPSAIQFAKLIETEIEDKIHIPFRQYFKSKSYEIDAIKRDIDDNLISRMTKFLSYPSVKAPELGSFAFFLNVVRNSASRNENSLTVVEFKKFIGTLSNPQFILSDDFIKSINLITTKYRNGSAHTKALPFSYLSEFYLMLFEEGKNGFFFKFMDGIKPPSN